MKGKTCYFIGHRYGDVNIERLVAEIEQHIVEYGVDTFIVGHYGFFDLMAAHYTREAKEKHPHIKLYRLQPYFPGEREHDESEYYDGIIYLDGMETVPRRFAIVQANHRMVDGSDYLIANAWKPGSNSLKLVEYARRKKHIQVTNLVE